MLNQLTDSNLFSDFYQISHRHTFKNLCDLCTCSMASNVEPMLVEQPDNQFKKPKLSKTIIRHAINNFSTRTEEKFTKPKPSVTSEPQFYARLNPNKDGHFSFHLYATQSVRAACVLQLFVNHENQETRSFIRYFSGPGKCRGWSKFCKRSDFMNDSSKFVENGDLVSVKGTIYYWKEDDEHQFGNLLSLTDFSNLADLSHTRERSRHDWYLPVNSRDVVITLVDGQSIRAHKAILCSTSDYFKAMFENTDSIEARTNTINIVDFLYPTVNAMIDWIYGRNVSTLDSCVDLLRAADKYQLEGLKFECQQHLANDVTLENVLDTLVIDDKYSATKLKAVVMDLIVINRSLLFKDVRVFKEALPVDLSYELLHWMSK